MSVHRTGETSSSLENPPRIRDRDARGQMFTFTLISVATVSFMTLLPLPDMAFGAVDVRGKAARSTIQQRTAAPREIDRLCHGQTWGSQTLDCVLAIARDAGIERPVRLAGL